MPHFEVRYSLEGDTYFDLSVNDVAFIRGWHLLEEIQHVFCNYLFSNYDVINFEMTLSSHFPT